MWEDFFSKRWFPKGLGDGIQAVGHLALWERFRVEWKGKTGIFLLPKQSPEEVGFWKNLRSADGVRWWGEAPFALEEVDGVEAIADSTNLVVRLFSGKKSMVAKVMFLLSGDRERRFAEKKMPDFAILPQGGVWWEGHDLVLFYEDFGETRRPGQLIVEALKRGEKEQAEEVAYGVGALLGNFHAQCDQEAQVGKEVGVLQWQRRMDCLAEAGGFASKAIPESGAPWITHGDFFFGQVTVLEKRFFLMDFGGEPVSYLMGCSGLLPACRDVACGWRSLENMSFSQEALGALKKSLYQGWLEKAPQETRVSQEVLQTWEYERALYENLYGRIYHIHSLVEKTQEWLNLQR